MRMKEKIMEQKIYKKVCIEITDGCNANCKWCTTGIKNRTKGKKHFHFLPAEDFRKAIDYLEERNLIDKGTSIELYNWGEPFLNPELSVILDDIVDRGYSFHLSTNGSKYIVFSEKHINAMEYLTFSLSGMTTESYGKIHGLDLPTVLSNIEKTADQFRAHGQEKKILLNFHLYQFNMDEIPKASRFAEKLGIAFVPMYAYFNDHNLFERYLNGTVESQTELREMQDIFTFHYDAVRKEQPNHYSCPEWEFLTLDSYLQVVPCDSLTAERDSCGMLSNISTADIGKPHSEKCSQCIKNGHAYLMHCRVLSPGWCKYVIDIQAQDRAIKADLSSYDFNLKKAIEQRDTLQKELTDYDRNLKEAIMQREGLQAELESYDLNLKQAINQREQLRIELNKIKNTTWYRLLCKIQRRGK